MKHILFLTSAFITFCINAQKIEGVYPKNNNMAYGVYQGQASFKIRRDGAINSDFAISQSTRDILPRKRPMVFYPVPNTQNTYEDKDGKYRLIGKTDNAFIMYILAKGYRYVRDTMVFAKDKKALKATMASLKGAQKKMSFKEMMKALKDDGSQKVKSKVDVENLKFFAYNATSKFHEKHAGKIVFFSEKTIIGSEDESKIKTSFKVGEPIWSALYLPTSINKGGYSSLVKEVRDSKTLQLKYYLTLRVEALDEDLTDKEKYVCWTYIQRIRGSHDENTSFVFQVLPGFDDNLPSDTAIDIADCFSNLGEYKHELRFKVDGKGNDGKIFFGDLSYDLSSGKQDLASQAKKFKDMVLDAKALPKPYMKDHNLEKEMIAQANLYATGSSWSSTCTKAIIASDWSVLNGNDGSILGKYIRGFCVFHDPSGEGCGYISFGFLKDYNGGGSYSSTIRQYDIGSRGSISCDKAK